MIFTKTVVYELNYGLKVEMVEKIKVNTDQLQDNILAACYNGAISSALATISTGS